VSETFQLQLPRYSPTAIKAMNARKRFRAKIAADAVPDTPIRLKSCAPVIAPLRALPPAMAVCPIVEWTERQKGNYQPWFKIVSELRPNPPWISEIQAAVARFYDVPVRMMKTASREHQAVRVRQIAMFLCSEVTKKTLGEIGRSFGNRDHSTALHGILKMRDLVKTDERLSADIEALKRQLLEVPAE
jgi:Bacterial dnaA protein helix-turn-helix